MAIVLENTDCHNGDGSSDTYTLAFTPTVGNKLLLAISQYRAVTLNLVQTTGVVWTPLISSGSGSGSTGVQTEHWFGDVVGPTVGTSLKVFASGSSDRAVAVHEVSGLQEVWPVDLSGNQSALSSPYETGATGVPLVADSYFFGSFATANSNPSTDPGAPTNGFTERELCVGPNANTNIGHRIVSLDKIVSAAESAFSDATFSGTVRWVGLVTTFKGVPATPKPIALENKHSEPASGLNTVFTLGFTPTDGRTLLMAVTLDANETVTNITQAGTTWVRDATETNGVAVTTEIWRASNVASASTSIDIEISGAAAGGFLIQEYSGILAVSPLDQTATNTGSGNPVTTALTAASTGADELVFGVLSTTFGTANFQEAYGYLRTDQSDFGSGIVGGTFIAIENLIGDQHQLSSDGGAGGDFATCIATYFNDLPAPEPAGPPINVYFREENPGGTSNPLSVIGGYAAFPTVAAGQFIDGHRHLVLATARVESFNGRVSVRLNVGGVFYDTSAQRPVASGTFGRSEMYNTARILTLQNSDFISLEAGKIDGNDGLIRQCSIVVIDLDAINFFEGRDWWHRFNTTPLANMDTTFANNTGATLRMEADGVSDYVVIGHTAMSCVSLTARDAENVARIRDRTNAVTLAQAGWHKATTGEIVQRYTNIMAVLEAPAVGEIELAIEMIGGGALGWDHVQSSITVMRMDQFFQSGFDQDAPNITPGDTMPPTASHVPAQAQFPYTPDEFGDMVALVYSEADNVAVDTDGLCTQAQYTNLEPGPDSHRSLWDTEGLVFGNIVDLDTEVVAGSYGTGNTSETRVSTWGASVRSGQLNAGTVQLFNGTAATGVLKKTCMVVFGRATAPVPPQSPPPDPVPIPTVVNTLQLKTPEEHEEEALDNLLEQFKSS